MKIAIEGCAHGELDKIYESINFIENREGIKVDLLICCGDFQSVRDHDDMNSMAVPPKYREMKDFVEYYNGKKKAPVLTLFIGGNHEAANYLWELPYGGWVAENIYYIGYAGVVNFGGIRIGGLTGIYKQKDFYKGHFETPPFTEDTKRSFYHVRSQDVAKLKLLQNTPFDIFLSHDWPKGIYHHGDSEQLIRFKPFLKDEICTNTLGSDAAEDLLKTLKPTYWFSGHMHAKFSAIVDHNDKTVTKFLALDKCLPRRNFLQIIDIDDGCSESVLKYDQHWIAVLQSTDDMFSKSCKPTFLVELSDDYKPTDSSLEKLNQHCDDFTVIPFCKSLNGQNNQTAQFCEKFTIHNPCVTNSTSITNNAAGSSRFSVKNRRMSLPKPAHTVQINSKSIVTKQSQENDDFSEITKPDSSLNPDEIALSNSSESDSNDGDTNDDEDNEVPSFIETPMPATFDSSVLPSDDLTSEDATDMSSCVTDVTDERKSLNETPIPKKKFKFVRRNQEIYSFINDEEETSQ